MKRARWITNAAVMLATLGLIAPQRAFAVTPAAAQPQINDLALGAGGSLTGQVVDAQGVAQTGLKVTVWQQEQQVAETSTDAKGNFAVQGLRGGVHHVAAGTNVSVYRLWAPNTAPPAAQSQAMVVSGGDLARGNVGNGGFVRFITNPWVLAGIVAAAIAVPIALNNDDDSGS